MNTDGTEDEEINCLNADRVAADVRKLIRRDITLATTMDSELEESDPFADVEEDE